MAWQEKFGNYKIITGYQMLKRNIDTNNIRFKVKVEGYLFAYVVGDFNHWKKSEYYKIQWVADSNDATLAMMKDIQFDEGLEAGFHQYSYLLIDADGNEVLLSAQSDGFKAFDFQWEVKPHNIEIKASENTIVIGSALELIAIKNVGNNRREIVPVEWKISPQHAGISFHNGKLLVTQEARELDEITVTATHHAKNLVSERTFTLNKEERTEKLIHFYKRDNLYSGSNFSWNLWTFDATGKKHKSVNLTTDSDFGITGLTSKQNVIARKKSWESNWHNDWSEQTPSFELNDHDQNYYIIHGDNRIYTSLHDVINRMNPRIELAIMDSKSKITAYLSDTPPVGTKFDLYINSIKQEELTVLVKEDLKQVIFLDLAVSPRSNDFVVIKASNNIFIPCKVTMRGYLDKFYYANNEMGIIFNNRKIKLRLWAPTAKQVELLLYNDVFTVQNHPDFNFVMQHEVVNGTHYIEIDAPEFESKYYLYRLHFDDLDNHGRHTIKSTYAVDPYANGIGLNGDKGVLLDINSETLMPENWAADVKPKFINPQDAIIYEMHIRDFTIKASSGVATEMRGKFLGTVESSTHYSSPENPTQSVTTGLDSLVDLGITHVHLLPIFDFSSVDETRLDEVDNRNWGYDPKNYNAPDGSYSLDPYDPSLRILETRKMIQKFHAKGIRVVMDMVYNHMTNTNNMDNIVQGYYFRTDNKGKFTNGSGCGNELATERPMVRKFIVDSTVHWIRNYKIDGMRFDLMELMDFESMKKIVATAHAIDPSILVYGEPWKGGDSVLTNGTYRGRQKNHNFSVFNDLFRDAIRGSNSPSNGFINGNPHNPLNLWHVIDGLKGSINGLTAVASESINYIDAHDNYTLWDHIEKSQNQDLKIGEYRQNLPLDPFESTLVRQYLLGLGIILTAQGIPFFQGGAEILRTKNGDHNSYKSDDTTNAFHWEDKLKFLPVFNYIKGLIELRKHHPAFRMSQASMINEHLNIYPAYHTDSSGVIIAHYTNHANGDSWEEIVVIYNASNLNDYDVNEILPKPKKKGHWKVVVNHEKAGIEPILGLVEGKIPLLKSHSILVVHD